MASLDLLALGVWFHLIVVGALIPNLIVRAYAGRGAIPGEPGWISDNLAFALFIIGAFISLGIYSIASTCVGAFLAWASGYVGPLPANAILVVLEFLAFKRFFLGRE
jgi:hypothetical protein